MADTLLDLERIRDLVRGRVFLDLRNIYQPETVTALGFRYVGIGRSAPRLGGSASASSGGGGPVVAEAAD